MDEDERHQVRMAAGQSSLELLDAYEDDEVTDAIEDLARCSLALRSVLADRGITKPIAVGMIVGSIICALTGER